ncbi:MAG: contractile injection system protein, VgrG/Pvc8 family, partial [Polyangiaceae bacterium]
MAKDYLSIRIETDDFDASDLQLHRLSGREAISELFQFRLEVVKKGDALALDDVVGCTIAIVYERAEHEVRRVFGMIAAAEDHDATEDDHFSYTFTDVPRAHRMTLVETLEIYMDMTVPEIIEKKLSLVDLGAKGIDYELRLSASYPKREFVVQYRETDMNFVARLTEHLGISYFFEHHDGKDRMIFTDSAAGFHDIVGDDPQVGFHRRG